MALCSRRRCRRSTIWWPWAQAAPHGGLRVMVSLRWHEARHSSYSLDVHCHPSIFAGGGRAVP